jgi:diguanylate cyclase (GGDEF)-like protein
MKPMILATIRHHHRLFGQCSLGQLLLALLFVLALPGCSSLSMLSTPTPPKAIQGMLDLRNWDFGQNSVVRLDGEWGFAWDQSIGTLKPGLPTKDLIQVPGSWIDAGFPLRGKAVYSLRILTNTKAQLYGMKIYEFPQSYQLFVNGQFIIENGKYNENPALSNRSLVRPVVIFASSDNKIDIQIEVVNLDEQNPGPRRSLILGLEKDIRQLQENQLIVDMLMAGVLLIMAVYHLGLYFQRRREIGSLLFGLVCFIMILRIAVTEEHYLHKYLPSFPGNIEGLLDVFSFFILPLVFVWIFQYFFKDDSQAWVRKVVTIIFSVFSIIYVIAPSQLLFNFYLVFAITIGVYLGYVLFLGLMRRRPGAGVFLAGFLVLFVTAIWDILSQINITRGLYISQIGFVVFIFSQAYVLSIRFNQALFLSEELAQNLEHIVAERTRALEVLNQKLAVLNITDALTKIYNRRYFDESLETYWQQALNNKQPLSLCILDIDNFKAYNDYYGHQNGDECLKNVANLLTVGAESANSVVARYGGEEFVILTPQCPSEAALAIAEQVRQTVEAAALPHHKSAIGMVSVSIGVHTIVPAAADTSQQFIKIADDALYQAKKQGRNRVVVARLG